MVSCGLEREAASGEDDGATSGRFIADRTHCAAASAPATFSRKSEMRFSGAIVVGFPARKTNAL